MSAFYTPEAMATIWATEMEMEHSQAMLEAYDPYADFDDEYFEDEHESFEGNEDAGMEGYLFGWDSQSLPALAHLAPFVKFTITLKSPLKLSVDYGMVNL